MNALLSIKPEFADKILSGEKQYEFRKTRFSSPAEVDTIFMYASSPAQELVGSFTFDDIVKGPPAELWREFGEQSGIKSESRFMDYFSGNSTGYAIAIDEVTALESPIDPHQEVANFRPPVSFQYVNGDFDPLFDQQDQRSLCD